MEYPVQGVCSRSVEFEIDKNRVYHVKFQGGCNGNLKAIASLVDGMEVQDVITKLRGIRCGFKNTSCPDQLAKALEKALEESKQEGAHS